MYVERGGDLYGFCPAKATWNPKIAETFRLLMIVAESGVMLNSGGLYDQPGWLIEALGWFLPRYQQQKISMYAKMFLGDGKKKGSLRGSQPAPPRKGQRGNNSRQLANGHIG